MHVNGAVNCECEYCKNRKEFDMPEELIESTINGNLVIFAGAGVSTESKKVYRQSLYEKIKYELGINENLSFSKLMSKYCKNTNGRIKLLTKIKERFDYVTSFPELEREASSFHGELSTIFQIKEIITTNWDDLFERYCGALPIVTPEDFVFWNLPQRKVLKIHGSINNLGSIIATEEDYNKCYEDLNTGLVGSSLKVMLATKCIVFIGYSFGDEDFTNIYKTLFKEMKGLMPHAYIVTIDENSITKYKEMNLNPIITDATYFISKLKDLLVEKKQILNDDNYITAAIILDKVYDEHRKLSKDINIKQYPHIIYSLYYQDGLKHALERILALKKTGHYSHKCNIENTIYSYEKWRKEKNKSKLYNDVAYIEGYIEGLGCIFSV